MRVSAAFAVLSSLCVSGAEFQSFKAQSYHAAPFLDNKDLPIFISNMNESRIASVELIHKIKTTSKSIYQPSSRDEWLSVRAESWLNRQSPAIEWVEREMVVPDVTDRETLRQLAKMTYNAYFPGPDAQDWIPLGHKWENKTAPFGWDTGDGIRGQVFRSMDQSIVVISIKGTSAGFFGGGGTTAKNDKFNDNLLFSCCCARVGFTWSTVCDCYDGGWNCRQDCLEEAVATEGVYYPLATNLYNNITHAYPDDQIWLVGHSLGGSLASLLGLTFGVPVVAFEAPGERMAAQRLHLPMPPGLPWKKMGITHVYNTADPIAMGYCNGVTSACAIAGFAMESRCHSGETILYDTVAKLGWASDLRAHEISVVLDKILDKDWDCDEDEDEDPDDDGNHHKKKKKPWWPPSIPGRDRNDGDNIAHPSNLISSLEQGFRIIKQNMQFAFGRSPKSSGCTVPKAASEDDCEDCYRWSFLQTEPKPDEKKKHLYENKSHLLSTGIHSS